jgi:hypothetical protein
MLFRVYSRKRSGVSCTNNRTAIAYHISFGKLLNGNVKSGNRRAFIKTLYGGLKQQQLLLHRFNLFLPLSRL